MPVCRCPGCTDFDKVAQRSGTGPGSHSEKLYENALTCACCLDPVAGSMLQDTRLVFRSPRCECGWGLQLTNRSQR